MRKKIITRKSAYVEHSMVISNFLVKVGSQLQNSMCKIFSDNVQYKWIIDDKEKRSFQMFLLIVALDKDEEIPFSITRVL